MRAAALLLVLVFSAATAVGAAPDSPPAEAPRRVLLDLIHEFSNSLCVETPIWLGDAGWSAYLQITIKTALGGKFADNVRGELDRRVAASRKWEAQNGLYDLTSEKNPEGRASAPVEVGAGKVLGIFADFEKRYGPDVMKRYFAAARKWKDDPAVKAHPIGDRVVFYFSLATGQDQVPYFKKLGTNIQRIVLPDKP